MTLKCLHKGCGKAFTDPDEDCLYHPGPPVFHEGQKGWKCCKPRVLTFDEFLSIPPCTTGKHSIIDDTPSPAPPEKPIDLSPPTPTFKAISANNDTSGPTSKSHVPQITEPPAPSSTPPPSESDDPDLPVPPKITCRRRGCDIVSKADINQSERDDEKCVYHPGHPIFHEGSKGWTCCKRRVLEFDEFMRIEGCKRKNKHLFVGRGKDIGKEELLANIRHDFYQTSTNAIASLYLKKIDKEKAKVEFISPTKIALDLPTTDLKRYKNDVPLFGSIDTAKSTYKIMGTKLELTLVKLDGSSWPTLRSDERRTSEIIQLGKPGRA